jgi:hypothetical protein
MEHAVIVMVRWTAFGTKFLIFILQFAFSNFQWQGTGWGKSRRAIGK